MRIDEHLYLHGLLERADLLQILASDCTRVVHRPRLVLAAALLGELPRWGGSLPVMQRVGGKGRTAWVSADERWLGNTSPLPASWGKWPRFTKWCSFWMGKSNTGQVLCYQGWKPLALVTEASSTLLLSPPPSESRRPELCPAPLPSLQQAG